MAPETKLRVLIVGLSLWLFRYLVIEGFEKPDSVGIALVDMLASVVTLKAATCGQFKTGHSEWAKT
jgi:hypothetical protein